jgi:hypothetical protein
MTTLNLNSVNSAGGLRAVMTDPLVAGLALALLVRFPVLVLAAMIGPLLARWSRQRERRKEIVQAGSDLSTAGRILLVGLTGGLALQASLEMASAEVGPLVAQELNAVLRTARREGMAGALAASAGSMTRPLFSRLALAHASGAPMVDGVAAFLAEARAVRRAEATERARRLPVTLMIPLGLLILPGFVILFVGPIILTSVRELFGSLP